MASTPHVAPYGAVYVDAVEVKITTVMSEAQIRYTTDNTPVTQESAPYAGPFTLAVGPIGSERVVRATLFKQGLRPSLENKTYIMREPTPEKRPSIPPLPPDPDVFIDDLKPVKKVIQRAPKSGSRGKWKVLIRYGGKQFDRGVAVFGNSELVYEVKPNYGRFVAVVGLTHVQFVHSSWSGMHFHVYADDTLLAKSPRIMVEAKGRGRRKDVRHWVFNVEIPKGTRVIRLVTDDGGDGPEFDCGDWANAGFVIADTQ